MLSTVNVPPPKSSRRSLFSRARLATSAMAALRPWIDSVSASRMTGTMSPSSTATATPMLTRRLASRPCSVQWALNVGFFFSASARRLDDERDEREADPLLRLVRLLDALAEPHELRRVDLHLDVGVRGAEGAGHLGRDALAHLGHRDEDLVRAGGERDAGVGRGSGSRRRAAGRRRGARGGGGRGCGRRCRGCLAGPHGLDVGEDVLAGDPATAAGAGDLRGLEPVLAEQPPDGRGHAGVRVAVGRGGRGRRGRPRSRRGRCSRRWRRRARRSRRAVRRCAAACGRGVLVGGLDLDGSLGRRGRLRLGRGGRGGGTGAARPRRRSR